MIAGAADFSVDDGGYAFPVPMVFDGAIVDTVNERGMSLRDYFAGRALSCFGTAEGLIAAQRIAAETGLALVQAMSNMAYELADAMLVERNKSGASSSATATASDASSRNADSELGKPAPSEARPPEGSDR